MAAKLTDKQRKKILADYIQLQNYREVGRKNKISEATVRNIVRDSDIDVAQEFAQKEEENMQDTLDYMKNNHELSSKRICWLFYKIS